MDKPCRVELLQAGRGIAAVGVLVYHANIFCPVNVAVDYAHWGVQFFFFLSGYVIFHVHDGRPFSLASFTRSRIERLYPSYLPIGIAAAFAYIALGRRFDWAATITLLPGRTALISAWTLQHEVFFYALAAMLFVIRRPIAGMLLWGGAIAVTAALGERTGPASSVILSPENMFFVLGAATRRVGWVPKLRMPKPALALGDASYAIYLVHLPLMGGLWRLGANFPTLVGASLVAGFGYHYAFELPMLRWIKHRGSPKASKFPASRPSRTTTPQRRPRMAQN